MDRSLGKTFKVFTNALMAVLMAATCNSGWWQ
jgi:hypothetical protein